MPDTSTHLSHPVVRVGGVDPTDEFALAVLDVTIETSLHLPDVATIRLNDPHLRWIDDPSLAPGNALEVIAKFGQLDGKLFDGEIVELEPDFGVSVPVFVVRAFDRLHRLARGRRVRSFQGVTDGDLVSLIAGEANLSARAGPTSQVHDYIFQTNETNLTFLQRRAMALGYLLFVETKTLHCEAPKSDGPPIELAWGKELIEFRPRLTTVDQLTEVSVHGWDPEAKEAVVGKATTGKGAPAVGESRDGGQVAKAAFSLDSPYLVADRPIRKQSVADQLAQAVADRQASRFIEAEGCCEGNPKIVSGVSVKISSVGERFSGTYFVTSTTHSFSMAQGYVTRFNVSGLHPSTLLGLLSPESESVPTNGLVIGIVTDNQDPKGQGRVKVKYPWLTNDHASDWARVMAPGAGADRGIEFLPEVDDEVLVGFELGDIHHPYVLGGLWNGKDAPPKKSSDVVSSGKVQRRIIKSRSGHIITLDDTSGSEAITVVDKTGNNQIAINSSDNSMQIKVQGDLTIESQGKITLKGTTGIEMSSQADLKLSGQSGAELTSTAQVKVKGSMTNVEADGIMTIKGSLIQLN